MNKTISIKNQVELSDIVENYLNPEYIYIPISTKDEILVKVGAKVLKEEPIIKRAREIVSFACDLKRSSWRIGENRGMGIFIPSLCGWDPGTLAVLLDPVRRNTHT